MSQRLCITTYCVDALSLQADCMVDCMEHSARKIQPYFPPSIIREIFYIL